MLRILAFLLLIFVAITPAKEILQNGNFDNYDHDWLFECQTNPICDENLCLEIFGSGYYIKGQAPCRMVQCIWSGGQLTLQVSSLDLKITFNDQPFQGELISDNLYRGNVSCDDDYCCLIIDFTNTTVYLDNISLDDGKVDMEPIIFGIVLVVTCLLMIIFTVLCNKYLYCCRRGF